MAVHRIKRGLDLPITGMPKRITEDGKPVTRVALLADDYIGMKPRMMVHEGDSVKRGQALFEDRKTPGVFFTAPGAGIVANINRGAKRVLQSVVIALNDNERSGNVTDDDHQIFESWEIAHHEDRSTESIRELLIESGLWTAFRTRPFSKVPAPDSVPHSIFVTAIDTHPLAAPIEDVLAGKDGEFERGLTLIAKLTDGKTYLCVPPATRINPNVPGVSVQEFVGKHPAGVPGVHIHALDPVHRGKTVWHIGCQDVVAIARLFTNGKLDCERVISLGGPAVRNPRLLRTRVGAAMDDLVADEIQAGEVRVISGSVLSGRAASGAVFGYLGRYHTQVSALRENRRRDFLGWLTPGLGRYSTIPAFLSKLLPNKRFDFTTTTNGEHRAMVPIGMYERVMPLDIMPTFLLRALAVHDIERAEALGCLELDEEDLALCSFVCPGKTEWGAVLRENLTMIAKEG